MPRTEKAMHHFYVQQQALMFLRFIRQNMKKDDINDGAQFNEDLLYAPEETDPRFSVEYLDSCPQLSPTTDIYFNGFSWDECGVVFRYNDGDNSNKRSFELKVVFPCTFQGMRVTPFSLHQENKLWELQHHSGAAKKTGKIFHFYKCKYSSYYNWYMQQYFPKASNSLYHYVISAEDTWIDLLSQDEPKIFCQYFGMHMGKKELEKGYIFNAFYQLGQDQNE